MKPETSSAWRRRIWLFGGVSASGRCMGVRGVLDGPFRPMSQATADLSPLIRRSPAFYAFSRFSKRLASRGQRSFSGDSHKFPEAIFRPKPFTKVLPMIYHRKGAGPRGRYDGSLCPRKPQEGVGPVTKPISRSVLDLL